MTIFLCVLGSQKNNNEHISNISHERPVKQCAANQHKRWYFATNRSPLEGFLQSKMLIQPAIAMTTMKACQGSGYGAPQDMLKVETGVKIPSLADIPKEQRKDWAIIKVHAVALAPGDCRVLSGKTAPLQGPPAFPYTPGGDVCGTITELDDDVSADLPFKIGDRVCAMFHGAPRGALGDYAAVHASTVCSKVPDNVRSTDAASLGSSGPAAIALFDRIKKGDRVLILGAGGGVGSLLCQLARIKGASFVAGVSSDPGRLTEKPLAVDAVVDYTKNDPFSKEEWQSNKFDTIIDLASGGWLKLLEKSESSTESIVKPANEGGRYLTLCPDEPKFEAHTWWAVLKIFLFPAVWRAMYSRLTTRGRLPKYTYAIGLPSKRTDLDRILQFVSDGQVVPCVDRSFPFTTEGIVEAFKLQESRHVKGKVVISVADE